MINYWALLRPQQQNCSVRGPRPLLTPAPRPIAPHSQYFSFPFEPQPTAACIQPSWAQREGSSSRHCRQRLGKALKAEPEQEEAT